MITQYNTAQLNTTTTSFCRYFIHKLPIFYLKYRKKFRITTIPVLIIKDQKNVFGRASLLNMENH